MKFDSKKVRALVAVALVTGVAGAHAAAGAAIDVTDVVGTISAQLTPINLVGVGVLGIAVAVKAYQWVRRALS